MEHIKIKVKSLSKSFSGIGILQNINLDIYSKQSVVILGKSGVGKSVLAKIIIGLIEPDSGEVFFDGVNTTNISYSSRLAMLKHCGFLFQNGALFDSLDVRDNITFLASKLLNLNNDEKTNLAIEKLRAVGLSEKLINLFPSELSGGMNKRVALARAICHNPDIIFFDEPTSGLDPYMSALIADLIIKFQSELGATTITITHDIHNAMRIANDIVLIEDKQIVWKGNKDLAADSNNTYINSFLQYYSAK
ncbi:ABC transporter ATP-binding protein [Rickettsia endosymbiont of Cardiosporidium cionae]|uniref:ABC transporter ATP-binding protein n=1 Tax=Rickettsia endosymbiont of Cardiosporidium cionae TaxID=2777155 RepID=UPI0018952620|nr:ATP-binding cassette domain-containing protein [Rickettsia endosymbiont of Cardiosporidium cionae]KAF8818119.1 ABC transporter ATP-binding protein [Rickettsia endosymbiont of Cardiosporidium cionae]